MARIYSYNVYENGKFVRHYNVLADSKSQSFEKARKELKSEGIKNPYIVFQGSFKW